MVDSLVVSLIFLSPHLRLSNLVPSQLIDKLSKHVLLSLVGDAPNLFL